MLALRTYASRVAGLAMAPLVAGWASAQVVDQRFDPMPVNTLAEVDEVIDHAQTFTVGVGGRVTALDLLICRGFNTTQPLLVDLRRTFGGVPAESDTDLAVVLASTAVPNASVPIHGVQWVHVELPGSRAIAEAGDVLALVLRPAEPLVSGDDDGYGWGGNLDGDQYARGTRYSRSAPLGIAWESFPRRDMGFATYVDITAVPEPDPRILVAVGLLALWGGSRRARFGGSKHDG